jgi:hypothetical protein
MARAADKNPGMEDTEWKIARAVFAALRKASTRAHVGIAIRGESNVIDGMFDPFARVANSSASFIRLE